MSKWVEEVSTLVLQVGCTELGLVLNIVVDWVGDNFDLQVLLWEHHMYQLIQ